IEDYRTHAHYDPWPFLERKPDRDFDIAWTATTYIRVLSAHIGSHRKRQVPLTPPGRVQPVARPIDDVVRVQRIREIGMVENVEDVCPQLHVQPFIDLRVLGESQVEVAVMRSVELIPAQRSIV